MKRRGRPPRSLRHQPIPPSRGNGAALTQRRSRAEAVVEADGERSALQRRKFCGLDVLVPTRKGVREEAGNGSVPVARRTRSRFGSQGKTGKKEDGGSFSRPLVLEESSHSSESSCSLSAQDISEESDSVASIREDDGCRQEKFGSLVNPVVLEDSSSDDSVMGIEC